MATQAQPYPRGRFYFEGFALSAPHARRWMCTLTQMTNMLFLNMTLSRQPLHIDAHFCAKQTRWGRPLTNSLFPLGLLIGICVDDTTPGGGIGHPGRFFAPLLESDSVSYSAFHQEA